MPFSAAVQNEGFFDAHNAIFDIRKGKGAHFGTAQAKLRPDHDRKGQLMVAFFVGGIDDGFDIRQRRYFYLLFYFLRKARLEI